MLNVKLSSETEQALSEYCQQKQLSEAQVVGEAVAMFLADKPDPTTPYQLGTDLFGQVGSGCSDASQTYKDHVKKIINEKHAH